MGFMIPCMVFSAFLGPSMNVLSSWAGSYLMFPTLTVLCVDWFWPDLKACFYLPCSFASVSSEFSGSLPGGPAGFLQRWIFPRQGGLCFHGGNLVSNWPCGWSSSKSSILTVLRHAVDWVEGPGEEVLHVQRFYRGSGSIGSVREVLGYGCFWSSKVLAVSSSYPTSQLSVLSKLICLLESSTLHEDCWFWFLRTSCIVLVTQQAEQNWCWWFCCLTRWTAGSGTN